MPSPRLLGRIVLILLVLTALVQIVRLALQPAPP
jgi:hypothetical protein